MILNTELELTFGNRSTRGTCPASSAYHFTTRMITSVFCVAQSLNIYIVVWCLVCIFIKTLAETSSNSTSDCVCVTLVIFPNWQAMHLLLLAVDHYLKKWSMKISTKNNSHLKWPGLKNKKRYSNIYECANPKCDTKLKKSK